ncbi:Outer membrane protein B precursor [Poriferisphaera corsica]|uniref:Outer membrane protein B n=1 Tax=Poriferisphaera corsica TaxID=2528020 RepID=A0A517YSS3_9BACT|nr:autotransporter outer membrane beta-barrel domain-containing protein [Poriferisphaera corsica]QDU33293.1 Outer membrane protein B precursor [Poriferisphaera corsica]
MISFRTHSTAALLAAFSSLTLTTPSHAGWVKTGSTYDYHADATGTATVFESASSTTFNLADTIHSSDPSSPYIIDLTGNTANYWLHGNGATVNINGKVDITSDKSGFRGIGFYGNSTLNTSASTQLIVHATGNHAAAIYSAKYFNDINGNIEIHTNQNSSHVTAIQRYGDIVINDITESAHIYASGGDYTNVIKSNDTLGNTEGNLTINQLAGDLTLNTYGGTFLCSAITAENNITIGSITKDSQINLIGNGGTAIRANEGDIDITGDLAGQIIGAENASVTGLFADEGNITINNVTEDFLISGTGGGTGIFARKNLTFTNDFSGKINISATGYNSDATGMFAYYGYTLNMPTFAKEASIILHSEQGDVRGMHGDTMNTSTFAGDIIAHTNSQAWLGYGLYFTELNIDTITADSQISVSAPNTGAFAIIGNDIDIQHIDGNISASGKTKAIAIGGYRSLNLPDITGTITATATDTDAKVAAITTERIYNNVWEENNPSDDIVTIANGGSVTGDIRLGNQVTTGDTLTLKNQATVIGDLINVETLNLIQDTPSLTIPAPVFNITTNSEVDETNKINTLDTIDLQAGTLNFAGNLRSTTFNAANNTTIQTTGNITSDSLTIGDNCTLIVPINAAEKSTGKFVADTVSIGKNLTIKSKLDGPIRQTTSFTLIKSNTLFTIDTSAGDNPIYMLDTALIDYESELSVDGGSIIITATTFGDLQDHAASTSFGAAKSLQNALDSASISDVDSVLAQFQAMDEPTLQKELEKITPQQSLSTVAASSSITTSFSGKLAGRTSTMSNSKLASTSSPNAYPLLLQSEEPDTENQYAFWTSAFGSIAEQDDTDNIAGYQSRSAGSLIGIDRKQDNLLIGAALGFAHADIDTNQSRGSTDLDALTTAAYFAYTPSNLQIDGGVIYTLGFSDYKRETALGRTAEADDVTSHAFTNYLGLSQSFTSNNDRLTLTPHAQISYTYFTQDSYEESKADALNLAVDSFDAHTLSSTLSFAAAYQYNDQLTLNSKLAYIYDINNDAPEATATFQAPGSTPFSTKGIETDKSAIELGLGMSYQTSDTINTSLDYNYQHRSSYNAQSLTLKLRILF